MAEIKLRPRRIQSINIDSNLARLYRFKFSEAVMKQYRERLNNCAVKVGEKILIPEERFLVLRDKKNLFYLADPSDPCGITEDIKRAFVFDVYDPFLRGLLEKYLNVLECEITYIIYSNSLFFEEYKQ